MTELISAQVRQPWFALYVKPRHEKHVSCVLRGKGYEEFVPLYSRRTRSRSCDLPLFPGYVFCRFPPHNRLPILSVPGVFYIVAAGGQPAPLEDEEIEALRKLVCSGLPRGPWPYIAEGEKVVLQDGPLRGVSGHVLRLKNAGRLIVSVSVLQRSVAIEIDNSWVAPNRYRPWHVT
ncbi:MAG TPA: transcription termination/antitermination NusG family protein [Bryobacteraceae bacterium]|nr:transcription termination/antitermination NusG family protein [Bryobacteraceae bacterium]